MNAHRSERTSICETCAGHIVNDSITAIYTRFTLCTNHTVDMLDVVLVFFYKFVFGHFVAFAEMLFYEKEGIFI